MAPDNPPANALRIPYPVAALLLTAALALIGWGNSIRTDVSDAKSAARDELRWREKYEKDAAKIHADLGAELKDLKKQQAEDFKVLTGQNTDILNKLTDVRLVMAAKIH